MAGASVRVRVDDKRVREALDRLVRAGGNMEDALADIGEHLIRSHRDRFARGVDPEGRAWQPLKPGSRARKRKNADKVLIESGMLMESLHYNVAPDRLEFGTDRIYGATHQFGRPEANIPARPFLGISREDEAEILNIIEDRILRALE